MTFDRSLRRRGGLVLLGALGLGASLGALAAVKYVTTARLDIVDKKRAVAGVVTTVDRNTALTVIAKEGRWFKVEVNGKQGYANEQVLADQPVGPGAKTVNLGSLQGGSNPVLENAAAAKGLTPGAESYASGKGLRTDGFRELQRRRESVTPAEFERFLAEAGAGGARADAGNGAAAGRPALASSGADAK